jgi:hypothetical protein
MSTTVNSDDPRPTPSERAQLQLAKAQADVLRREAETAQRAADTARAAQRRRDREQLRADRRAARTERAAQRRDEREQRRATRSAERTARRATRRATLTGFVRRAAANAGDRIYLVPLAAATCGAWWYQVEAMKGAGINAPVTYVVATALEAMGLALGRLSQKARAADDSPTVYRLAMWAVVGVASAVNYRHGSTDWNEPGLTGVVFAVLSIASVGGWELRERQAHRARIADRLPASRPAFGVARWLRYPMSTAAAWSVAVRDGLTDAAQALATARAERASRRVGRTFRRADRKLVAARIDAADRTRLTEAQRVLNEAAAIVDSYALLLGPDALVSEPAPAPRKVRSVRVRVPADIVQQSLMTSGPTTSSGRPDAQIASVPDVTAAEPPAAPPVPAARPTSALTTARKSGKKSVSDEDIRNEIVRLQHANGGQLPSPYRLRQALGISHERATERLEHARTEATT